MGVSKKTIKLVMAIILSALTTLSYADGGFLVGMQVGQGNLNNTAMYVNTGSNGIDADFPVQSDVPCTGVNTPNGCSFFINTTPGNTGIMARIFGGMGFNRYVAVETGLGYFTPSSYNPSVNYQTHEPQTREYTFDVLGRFTLPIQNFGVFAKGGLAAVYVSSSGALNTPFQDTNTNGNVSVRPEYGFGVSYSFSSITVDLSTNTITKGSEVNEINYVALGIIYQIVDQFCGQFLC